MIDEILALDARSILKSPATREDEELLTLREKDLTLNGLPYMVVAFGNGKITGKDIMILFYTDGMRPLSAFMRMRKSIDEVMGSGEVKSGRAITS